MKFLFNTSLAKSKYIFFALLISLPVNIIIATLLYYIFPEQPYPEFDYDLSVVFLELVIFAPIFETLLMWFVFFFLREMPLMTTTWRLAIVSGVIWAAVHSMFFYYMASLYFGYSL